MFTFLPHISRIVFSGSIGFVCGVFFASFFALSLESVLFSVNIVALGIFIFSYKKKHVWILMVFVGLFCVGFLVTYQHSTYREFITQRSVGYKTGHARVVAESEMNDFYSQIFVRYDDEDFVTLLKDEKHTMLMRGDVLQLSCKRTVPESFDDFDYRMYLAMQGVYLVCEEPTYEVVGHEEDLLGYIARLRRGMEDIINAIIPAPGAALANGLLFGGSSRLSQELQDDFSQTGMTHIVAVSGYNVSIIIAVALGVLIFVGLQRRWAVVGAIASVIFFVALIGFPSSGVRAAVMGIMVLTAAVFGRVTHAYGAILFSAAVMLFFNPLLLRYDIGFQLSFLATLGIIAVYPIVEHIFIHKKMAFGILEVLLLTVSAQIFVVPIIAYHFHTFSVVSLLANVMILPIIPLTMLFVFLTVVGSFVFYPLALLCGWIAYTLLTYEVFIIRSFANLSFSSITITHFPVLWMVVYYVFIVSILYYINSKNTIYER